MTFTKTSQKFGQWSDVRANTVYGLGFSSESGLNKFIEKFHEVKEATRTATNGTIPMTSASASPVAARSSPAVVTNAPTTDNQDMFVGQGNQNEMNSNLMKSQLAASVLQTGQPPQDSPKKNVDKGPAPNPPLSGEAQLKYENDRLKLALAQSSANAKKWEVELSTLKNNNARLTSALQESTSNVEEWKRQLHSYKEENARLKMSLMEAEAGRGNCDFDAVSELREMRNHFEDLEHQLDEKNEEIKRMKENGGKADGDEIQSVKLENESLKLTLDKVQSQLDTSLDAQEQQRKVLEAINRQFGDHLHHLGQLQNELTQVLNT